MSDSQQTIKIVHVTDIFSLKISEYGSTYHMWQIKNKKAQPVFSLKQVLGRSLTSLSSSSSKAIKGKKNTNLTLHLISINSLWTYIVQMFVGAHCDGHGVTAHR